MPCKTPIMQPEVQQFLEEIGEARIEQGLPVPWISDDGERDARAFFIAGDIIDRVFWAVINGDRDTNRAVWNALDRHEGQAVLERLIRDD